ncbi:MAG: hypothetical protein A2509_06905 [Candidatus Edwardsbacteria bacterium RIFOXYD12_FULL_50_11]|uniref:Deoxyhypusine synthase n=1 Tax=Candidatus Edwardsbacteria bacterium GWF2_54_11 TaxID=1817851 RepID=A0A1F5RFF9_9BACT|nr:MAG: hypothetical protein A2502_09710 [Candidatus Edwardsbacteria bacterium RifOxyC12_full_54_24]OGF06879.1 MAG: hypothetical protein A2273_01350 [Candidatus Edwardsbacteria bacterium RifOxyA12_full_54_48]OGF10829.1 MAG: hypothetical protein A3K15_06720 [Candidatus Edwardsbacteria bacterium GWE2_54_12]OGF13237.1 MAG: hypothetical protein A2024_09570 [Candidatus Edwardsbacteria bacterium GWF2_54_11]OGF15609.1 MAG: hypothetical protein A2509_06905 [Candidatus Edwardsbacteria bacterium RIFOXYD1
MGRYPEADLTKVKRYSIAKRKSKVGKGNLAGVPDPARPLKDFIKGLPDVLRARDLREIAAAVNTARRKKRPVLLMMGAHPVKCGLNPVIIDLMKRGFITGLATNGAGAIHDFELACWGRTSEDVQIGLEDGSFGMARETADLINGAVIQGDAQDLGFGETLGLMLNEGRFPFINHSLLAEGYRLKIPVTVHVALGTDIIHQHPSADGAAIGSASHRDFRILAEEVSKLSGGVVINLGSSVILPEVFLKALTVARNLGHPAKNFTTANFDMIQHYRPNLNVVRRPISCGGQGYSITGHHEIMLPLLAAMIKNQQIS